MPKTRIVAARLERDVVAAMQHLKQTDGASFSWQIESALRLWLTEKKGLSLKRPKASKRA